MSLATEPAMSSAGSLPEASEFWATMVLYRVARPPAASRPPPEPTAVDVL